MCIKSVGTTHKSLRKDELMPMGDAVIDFLLHQLYYGEPKTRKTWKSMQAAEQNFNVLIFDGDDGSQIVNQIRPDAKKNIRIIACGDRMDYPVFSDTIVRFLGGMNVLWDDTENRMATPMDNYDPTHAYFQLNSSKLTNNDVAVLDSWTALQFSAKWRWMLDNGHDITSGQRPADGFGMYSYTDMILDWILKAWNKLPCHTIIIAHKQTIDVVKKMATGSTDNKGRPIVAQVPTGSQKTVPISASKPHAEKLAKEFSDILDFQKVGSHIYIDTTTTEGRDGGSRTLHGNFAWEEITMAVMLAPLGIKPPESPQDMPACLYFPPGAQTEEQAAAEVSPVNDPLNTDVSDKPVTIGMLGNVNNQMNK